MSPVLEQLALAVREIIEHGCSIRTIARKHRQVVRAGQDIHRIDLNGAESIRGGANVGNANSVGLWDTEAQRGKRQSSCLGR